MTSFCKCDLCNQIKENHKNDDYPVCSYCDKRHDPRVACPECVEWYKQRKETSVCPACNTIHDKGRIGCPDEAQDYLDMVNNDTNLVEKPDTEIAFKIDPKECDYYIELEKGKYTVYAKHGTNGYEFKALRYSEPWQDLSGNNLVYYLMVDLIEAKDKLQAIKFVTEQNERLNNIVGVNVLNDILNGKME